MMNIIAQEVKLTLTMFKMFSNKSFLIILQPKFKIKRREVLGRGGFGTVYRGTMIRQKEVVLVAFKTNVQHHDMSLELKILASLDCLFVIRFFGAFKKKGIE
jgi:predicted Ser/Thr protein kinase